MKKLAMLAMLLACAILIGGCGSDLKKNVKINVDAKEGEAANGFTWENNYSEITVTGYIGDSNNLKIPDTINGKPVTQIVEGAFKGFVKLESIVIPDSCEKISANVFYGCESLTTIKIPDSCKEIGISAFCGCKSLTTINIPNSCEGIGQGAFGDCKSLTTIKIPDSCETIGGSVFDGCVSLKTIECSEKIVELYNRDKDIFGVVVDRIENNGTTYYVYLAPNTTSVS